MRSERWPPGRPVALTTGAGPSRAFCWENSFVCAIIFAMGRQLIGLGLTKITHLCHPDQRHEEARTSQDGAAKKQQPKKSRSMRKSLDAIQAYAAADIAQQIRHAVAESQV